MQFCSANLFARLQLQESRSSRSSMAVKKQGLVFLLACVSLVSTSQFHKSPPPSFNGCYKGRSDGSINVQAVFDQGGVRGYVQFYQPTRGAPTEVNINLEGLDQFSGTYPWHAHDLPVRNALLKDFPCSRIEIGGHYDPNNVGDDQDYRVNCNQQNRTACEVGDFGRKLGRLRNDRQQQFFVDETLDLYGPQSIVGRSLVIHYPESPNNRFICANVEPVGCRVKNLRAAFDNGVLQGEIVIRHVAGQDSAKIFVDLVQVVGDTTAVRDRTWSLHFGQPDSGNSCNGLRDAVAGDSDLHTFPDCTMEEHRLCRFGDLVAKCGPLQQVDGRMRLCCTDTQLGLIPLSTLFSPANNHFISVRVGGLDSAPDACARFDKVAPQVAKAKFSGKDIFGSVIFYQTSPLDRTFIQPHIQSIRRRNISLIIREGMVSDPKNCSADALGAIFSKPTGSIFSRPLSSNNIKTGDAFLIGNLGSAIPIAPGSQNQFDRSSSHYVPVFGPHTIVGHSLVVVQDVDGVAVPLACGNIERLSNYPSGIFASFTGYQNTNA